MAVTLLLVKSHCNLFVIVFLVIDFLKIFVVQEGFLVHCHLHCNLFVIALLAIVVWIIFDVERCQALVLTLTLTLPRCHPHGNLSVIFWKTFVVQ